MRSRSLTGPLLKSAVFVLVTVAATLTLAVSIAGGEVGGTERYRARFTDVTGLAAGDSVRISGVKVGEVRSIAVVDRRYAEVTFTVTRQRTLPAGTTAAVRYLTMTGQRYLALGQGPGEAGATLRPGGTIPLERTTPALDLTQLFNGFQPLFRGLSPEQTNQLAGEIVQVLQGEGATVGGLVRSIGSLTTHIAAEDEAIGAVIDNLRTVLTTVNERETGVTELITTLQRLVSGLSEDREPLGEAVTAIGDLSHSTAALLEEGREPLRQDIEELGRLSGLLAGSTPQVENFLTQTPVKMRALTRLASYGSWFNLYLCEATVTGLTTYDGSPAPTGPAATDARCAG
ncbi:MCE family protein [Streptomyces sp. YIM 98790]|uniref:MCE family protein n=1 Tax=Streptomyces sp. YIM 98790 TaxID=2689077 RepID=UPI00140C6879|nr:MCE family protein [Streptomyces sp. YIM 98790]